MEPLFIDYELLHFLGTYMKIDYVMAIQKTIHNFFYNVIITL
jgi:hypothetical protein